MVLSSITVNTLLDGPYVPSGTTSLRAAINTANQSTSDVTINFASSLTSQNGFVGVGAFSPLTPLPHLDNVNGYQITFNGLTNSDGGPATVIESWPANAHGYNTGTELFVDNGGNVTLDNVFIANSSDRGVANSGNLSLNNCFVWNNQNSGVMNAGTLTATNSSFDGNHAFTSGGAITNHVGGVVFIHAGIFNGNSSNKGGAVENYHGTVTIDRGSMFINNTAFNASSGIGLGGAISNENGTMTISASIVDSNTAAEGGGIYNFDGNLTVRNTDLSNNHAWYGGGLFDNVNTTDAGAVMTDLESDTILSNRAWYFRVGLGGGIDSAMDNVGVKMVGDDVYGNVSDSRLAPDIMGKVVGPMSSNNVVGVGDYDLTGIIDNNPNLRADHWSAKHYNNKVSTNYIGTAGAPLQPVLMASGGWDGMTYTYSYDVQSNVGTLVINAVPSKNTYPPTIYVDTVTSNQDPSSGDQNHYPSPNTPVGLQFADAQDSGPSINLSLGYDATSIATPTIQITANNGHHQRIVDATTFLTHTWNGILVKEATPK